MAKKKTAAPASGGPSLGLVVGLFVAAGLGWLVLKPSDAQAANASPPAPATQKCPDGSIIAASDTCPATATPPTPPTPIQPTMQTCPNGVVLPAGIPCPTIIPPSTPGVPSITTLLAGNGPTGIATIGLPNLPAVDVVSSDPNIAVEPGDYLLYVQAYKPGIPFTPIFPDGANGKTPIASILKDKNNGGPGGASTTAKSLSALTTAGGALNGYFDPQYAAQLEVPGVLTLIWTTDTNGNPVSWWLTSWKA